jgi:site-specific recombinase XerD
MNEVKHITHACQVSARTSNQDHNEEGETEEGLQNTRRAIKRVQGSHPEAFVFVNPVTGNPYAEGKLWKLWNGVRIAAWVSEDLRLYDACRHSFAFRLVNGGVSMFMVSKLLGHSSTKMTEKYSHANVDRGESGSNPVSPTMIRQCQ